MAGGFASNFPVHGSNDWNRIVAQQGGQNAPQSFSNAFGRTITPSSQYNVPNSYNQDMGQGSSIDSDTAARSNAAQQRIDESRSRMYELGEGRLDETRNDPIDAMILEQLQGRATTDVPYDDKTINQLITQGNESSAATYNNDQRSLDQMAGRAGVNAADPAYIAMQREAKERQNSSQIKNRRTVQSNARVENYNAQGQGLSDLGGANRSQQGRIDQRTDRLIDMYGREHGEVATAQDTQQAPRRQTTQQPTFNAWQQAPTNNYMSRGDLIRSGRI